MDDNPRLTVHDVDARPFLRSTDTRYDLIVVDAYRQPYVPFYLATREFFRLVRDHLAPGGIVALNVAAVPDDKRLVERGRRDACSRVPAGSRVAGAPLQHDRARLHGAALTTTELRLGSQRDRRSSPRSATCSRARRAPVAVGEPAVDGRPRAGRVADRPDDRRVRRRGWEAGGGLPADEADAVILARATRRPPAAHRPPWCARARAREHARLVSRGGRGGVDLVEFDVVRHARRARRRTLARGRPGRRRPLSTRRCGSSSDEAPGSAPTSTSR